MPGIGAILAWFMANPQIIALGAQGAEAAYKFVTGLFALKDAGVLTDDQLAAIWSSMGVDVAAANDHWEAAKARQGHV